MATTIKARFPLLLLLLGIVFLALVCGSSGIAHNKCLQRCNRVNEESGRRECRSLCKEWPQEEEEEEERPRHKEPGRRERGHQESEEQEEQRQPRHPHREREQEEEERPRREREEEQRPRQRGRGREEEEEGEAEWRGSRHREDPEERERLRRRRERRGEQEEEESESRSERKERRRRRREHEEEEGSSSSSESRGRKNPFFFRSNRFQTLFENENGRIRLLQRFDKRSNIFQNLQNYRLVEYRTKPHTLLLPQHTDADFILVVLSGKAILTVLNSDDRNSFNLERGDAIKIPAGTIAYLANRDDDEDLRVVDLAIPVNRPGQFQSFFPGNQNQQSYFHGFSKDILEASLNTKYEEIERVLLEEPQEQEQGKQQRRGRRERQQSQEANDPIVKVSREQIEELSKNAKSSSKKSISSKSEPFNLRSRSPIYSNKFGKFFEITPEKNPQLQDLNLFLSSVEIREGALLLPHYNSRAFVILVVNEGKGHLELVAQRNEQQQEQGEEEEEEEQQEDEERSIQVQRYKARLSPGDVFIIPSSHPVAVNASSDLSFLGFGINAENNQRNFLAGEDDNVISQIHRPVKELAFPGSAKEVDRLFDNQKQSYFANAQPQQREEGSQRRRSPLSSILGAFY